MATYVNIDGSNRIIGYNPNKMTGNTDWVKVPENIGDPITEVHGVPIYKYASGHAVSRTAEEIEADIPEPIPEEPTRLDEIEAQALYTAMMTDTLIEEV